MAKRLHAIVSGRVQAVSFRIFTSMKAKPLGLKGFVRNLENGTVEVVAEGDEKSLKHLLEMISHGPSKAEVKDVKIEWDEFKGEFSDFSIRH
ncbi:MAG: acylphosphatase [Candidatus Diapherotrites archaeon]